MPSVVESHNSHTARGRKYRVRKFIRYGPEHTAKWKRLVADLKRDRNVSDPYAVATGVLGSKSFRKPTAAEKREFARIRKEHQKK